MPEQQSGPNYASVLVMSLPKANLHRCPVNGNEEIIVYKRVVGQGMREEPHGVARTSLLVFEKKVVVGRWEIRP